MLTRNIEHLKHKLEKYEDEENDGDDHMTPLLGAPNSKLKNRHKRNNSDLSKNTDNSGYYDEENDSFDGRKRSARKNHHKTAS